MAKDQITWKRTEKSTGLASVGHDNSRRSWILCINGMDVGCINHTQACASSLRWSTKEEESAWKLMYYQSKGMNLVMKKRFPTPDRAAEAIATEEAKKTLLEWYPAVRVKFPDVRQAPGPKGVEPKVETTAKTAATVPPTLS
jgi:hypothetical protein